MIHPLSVPNHHLFDEFSQAVGNVGQIHFKWFRKHGVSEQTLFAGPSLCGAARVLISGNRFQPDPDGQSAVIVPVGVFDDLGWHRIDDLIAYPPDCPKTFATRYGTENLLGRHILDDAKHYGEPLRLHTTPHDWLVGGGTGVCIVDWAGPLAATFQGVEVLADSRVTGKRLQDAIDAELSRLQPDIRVA